MKKLPGDVTLLNIIEVAKLLRVHPHTIDRWLEKIPPEGLTVIRVGGRKMFALKDVLEYIESRKNRTGTHGNSLRRKSSREVIGINRGHLLEWSEERRDIVLSPRDAAKLLRIDESFLLKKIEIGYLPVVEVRDGIELIQLNHARILAAEAGVPVGEL
jgi:DNA-binding transcriptional MerR regulator